MKKRKGEAPNQALQTTSGASSVSEKISVSDRHRLGV